MHIEMTRFDGKHRLLGPADRALHHRGAARGDHPAPRGQWLPRLQPAPLHARGRRHEADRPRAARVQEARPIPRASSIPGKMIAWDDPDFDFDSGRAWLFDRPQDARAPPDAGAGPPRPSGRDQLQPRALQRRSARRCRAKGHEVDALNLYDEEFQPVMSRDERLELPRRAGQPHARAQALCRPAAWPPTSTGLRPPGVELRLSRPSSRAIFDRIFLPGVSFVLEGGDGPDKGKLMPKHEEHQEGRLRHLLWRRSLPHLDHGRPAAPPGHALGLGHLRHADAPDLPGALRHEQCHAGAARSFIAKVKRVIGRW